ncbi:TetR family transcriptional regulator C-terminal domain-containing protein [Nonomuraea candida]|uniref:TetR family transcriptional regulator C-terminal domain-containing protein n=1 Tax=Nonomuraea candida TaxID=359159 RepID=UPI003F6DD468
MPLTRQVDRDDAEPAGEAGHHLSPSPPGLRESGEQDDGRAGRPYDAALSRAASEPLAAVRAFFDVTLERIADPELPDGCLIAQTAMAIPVLSPSVAAQAKEALGLQRSRLRAALKAGPLTGQAAETFAEHVVAVNQSLAVMSRAGASAAQLLAVVEVTVDALSQALRTRVVPHGPDAPAT